MKEVSIQELRRDTERWVRLAAQGEAIAITDGGQRIAALTAVEEIHPHKSLPNREDKIRARSVIKVDSGDYISEMRG